MGLTVTHRFISPKVEQTDPTIVGPNEWNDEHVIEGFPSVLSTDYIFTPQGTGTNLIVGSNTIVMNPLPPGVIQGDCLYISGGAGTAEAVPVTGVSGNSIIVTCLYAHSGAWTIQSATAGIQEALNSMPVNSGNGWTISIPPGSYNVYCTIIIKLNGTRIIGGGMVNTQLSINVDKPMFSAPNSAINIEISNIQIVGPATGTSFGIVLVDQAGPLIENVRIINFAQGISNTGNINCQLGLFRNIGIYYCITDGVYINTSIDGGMWEKVIIGGGANGFHVVQAVGLQFLNTYTNGCNVGLYVNPGPGQTVGIVMLEDAYFDGYTSGNMYGILLQPAGGVINTMVFTLGAVAGFQSGLLIGYAGIGTIEDILFSQFQVLGNSNGGAAITRIGGGTATMQNIFFNNCLIEGNGTTGALAPGMLIQNVTNVIITGGVYAAGSYLGAGGNTQSYGIEVSGNTSGVHIKDAVVTPNVTGSIFIAGVNPGLIIKDCVGYNPVGVSAITVGASPFMYTNGPSPATIYIYGGTVSQVLLGGTVQIALASPCTVRLSPGESVRVLYTVAPTMEIDVE